MGGAAGNGSEKQRQAELDARIAAARARHAPTAGQDPGAIRSASLAWRMVTELVVGVLVGGAMGWGLDSLFGTLPLFLIVMGLLGFVAGVRVMMRSATEADERRTGRSARDKGPRRGGR